MMTKEMLEQLEAIKRDANLMISEIDSIVLLMKSFEKVSAPSVNGAKKIKLFSNTNEELMYFLTDAENSAIVEIITKITKKHMGTRAGVAIEKLNKLQDAKGIFEGMADDK